MQLHYVHRQKDNSLAHTTRPRSDTAAAPPQRTRAARTHAPDADPAQPEERLRRAYEHARNEAKRWKAASNDAKAELAMIAAENASFRASRSPPARDCSSLQAALDQAAEFELDLRTIKDKYRALKALHADEGAEYKKKLDSLAAELEETRARCKPIKAQHSQDEVRALQQRLDKSQSALAKTQATLAATEQRLAKSQASLATTEERLAKGQAALSTSHAALAACEQRVARAREKLADARSSADEGQARIAKLEGKLERAKERLAAVADLQSDLDRARSQLQALQGEAKRLEGVRAELAQARAQAARAETARAELAQARETCKRLESEQAAARTELKDLALSKAQLQTIQQRARESFQKSQGTVGECADMLHKVDEVLKLCACLHDKSEMGVALQQSRTRIHEFLKGISPPR
jgi:predicted  nucleic acid-binding Zn-ribbon protein